MIKPVKISPINTTNTLVYECGQCKVSGTIRIKPPMNTDNEEEVKERLSDLYCPKCGTTLM